MTPSPTKPNDGGAALQCPTLKYVARKDVWNTNLEQRLFIEIVHWGVDRENPAFEALNRGQGVWNYYITIPERIMSQELFEKEFWLDDKLVKYFETSPERVTHDYYGKHFNVDSWHGGVTFYEKRGHSIGHRAVKIGCDYSHLWDEERGYDYSVEEVLYDAWQTALELNALLAERERNK